MIPAMRKGARATSTVWLGAALVSVVALLSLCLAASASAAPGDPDLSFGGSGQRTFQPRGLAEPYVSDVMVQPDGKILVLGSTGGYHGEDHDIVVMRLNPDGSPDPSFGLGGTASIDFSKGAENADDRAGGMALQSNGKIIVVGQSYINTEHGEGPENAAATVARLNANGTLDTTFGVGATDEWAPGKLVARLGMGESGGSCCDRGDGANDVVVRPDNRIIVVGETGEESGEPPEGEFFALGLTADGGRDTSFGSYGRAFLEFGGGDSATAAALASNGDLILAGASYNGYTNGFAVARLSPSGSPVANFGSAGKRVLSTIGTGQLNDVAIQPDGKIALAASEIGYLATATTAGVIRLNPDGSTDSLGGHAFQPIPASGGYDYAGSVAIDSEGRLLASAISYEHEEAVSFRLARFTPAGALDTTFGAGKGFVQLPVGKTVTGWGFGRAYTALQSDGRIVLAGTDNGLFDVRRFFGGAATSAGEPSAGQSSAGPAGAGHGPRAKIVKYKVSEKRDEAVFTFTAAGATGFQCALVKPAKRKHAARKPSFAACRSPKAYKGLAAGAYTFEVRALGAAGTGPTARKKFTMAAR